MMEFLCYLLLTVIVLTLFTSFRISPKCSLGYMPLISGYNIVLICFGVYVAISAALPIVLNGFKFVWVEGYSTPTDQFSTLLVCWIALLMYVGFCLALRTANRNRSNRFVSLDSAIVQPTVAYALVAIGISFKVLYIQRLGGISNTLEHASRGISANLDFAKNDALSNYVAMISYVADAATTWLLLNAMKNKRQIVAHGFLTALILGLTYIIAAKRLVLFVPVMAITAGFGIYIRQLSVRQAPALLIASLGFGAATLFLRIYVPAAIAGVSIDLYKVSWASGSLIAFYLFSLELSTFESIALSVHGSHELLQRFGGWWPAFYRVNIEPFYYLVPRIIWPTKPVQLVDISHAVASVIYHSRMDETTVGIATTLIGTSWIFGGVVGLVVGMFLLAALTSRVDVFLNKMHYATPSRIVFFSLSCSLLFHFFRQGTVGWAFLIFFQSETVFLLTTFLLLYVSARAARVAGPSPIQGHLPE